MDYSNLKYIAIAAGTVLTATVIAKLASRALSNSPPINVAEMTNKTVVILGGSFGGLTVAHKLLRANVPGLKVILVTPMKEVYWNIATVRAIIPGMFGDDKLLQSFLPGFDKYPKTAFEFIQGAATGVDASATAVEVTTAAGVQTVPYDYLVVATGSSSVGANAPWKAAPTYDETVNKLHSIQAKVKTAKSIVIGGGGPTGTESACELGCEYGKTKEITLITGADQLLHGARAKVAEKVHVKVVLNTKIVGEAPLENGQTELTLSDGSKVVTDLYLPTVGVSPNTSFLPAAWLTEKKLVHVDSKLYVAGTKTAFAVGDATDCEGSLVLPTSNQAAHVAKNIALLAQGQPAVDYKVGAKAIGVTLGRSKGVGEFNGKGLPGFIVWFLKGRDLLTGKVPQWASGKAI